jgi:hypothetical protein
MTTSTGPDLSGAVAAFRALMDDTCTITRNLNGLGGDVLDEETGQVVPRGVPVEVYSGACLIGGPDATLPNANTEGRVQVDPHYSSINLPVDAPVILKGDILVCTGSRRDPQLVGNEYWIRQVVQESLLISRDLTGELR